MELIEKIALQLDQFSNRTKFSLDVLLPLVNGNANEISKIESKLTDNAVTLKGIETDLDKISKALTFRPDPDFVFDSPENIEMEKRRDRQFKIQRIAFELLESGFFKNDFNYYHKNRDAKLDYIVKTASQFLDYLQNIE